MKKSITYKSYCSFKMEEILYSYNWYIFIKINISRVWVCSVNDEPTL